MTEQQSTRRPTLADVAARSGMSKAAVSMILNDRPGTRLSAEAAEKVRTAAAELGYRPNPAAQSLRLGKTRTLGFISDQVTITRYASGMIRGVLAAAKERDQTVLIAETGGTEDLARVVQQMTDRRVDGLLIGLMAARQIDVPKVPHGVPVVVVNGMSSTDHPNILPDERAAGAQVAEHVLAHGHRRIGVIGPLPHIAGDLRRSATIGERFEGLDGVLDSSAAQIVRVEVEGWRPEVGYEKTHELLDAHPDITAIIAGNDNVAFGVYQAMGERGLRVGEDITVISFDDEELAQFQRPGLTTARLPYEEMARRGVEMILGERELSHERIPMPLIVRDSVRAPRD